MADREKDKTDRVERTLYEVLGVKRDAKANEIARAYNRMQAEQQKETAAPDPRLMAQAKVAFETLSDPGKRDEYDALLRRRALMGQGQKNKARNLTIGAVALIATIGFGIYAWRNRPVEKPEEKPLAPEQILAAATPQLGIVTGALMSGEVKELGPAVTIREGRMITTCQGLGGGISLTVKNFEGDMKAELTNPNEDLDICVLSVKGVKVSAAIRPSPPGVQEKLQAVFVNGAGKLEMRQVSGATPVNDAAGLAFEVKAAVPLPNGAALYDERAHLVGVVVVPHASSQGTAYVLSSARIATAKGTAPEKVVSDVPDRAPRPASPGPSAPQGSAQVAKSAREKANEEHEAAIRAEEDKAK